MSAPSAPPAASRVGDPGHDDRREGAGWLAFAGTMLAIVGTMNILYGIAAIDDATVFVNDARYVFSELSTWGWFLLFVGLIQFFAAFSIWGRTTWGVVVGIASAGLNAILQLLFLPAFPLLGLALFATNILIIYGLVAYGGRRSAV
jgi:hypothetical protein